MAKESDTTERLIWSDLIAPSGMFTLGLLPMRTHTCNAGGLREGIESQGGQIRARRRVKAATWCIADCYRVAAAGMAGKRSEESLQLRLTSLGWRRGTGGMKDDRSCWDVQRSQCLGGGGGVWQWKGTAVTAAWSRIKVQMPTEEFLQKNSTVIAIYRSCLGYSFSKCSL